MTLLEVLTNKRKVQCDVILQITSRTYPKLLNIIMLQLNLNTVNNIAKI